MGREETGCRQTLFAFGIPTILIADDPDLLATACTAYSDWVVDEPAAKPEIELRLETESAPSSAVSFGIQVKGSRLELAGPDFTGVADAVSKTAACKVPQRLVGQAGALASEITDTLLLFLLARSGRTPVHAAGFMLAGTAWMLMGPSGSGKSTLALAAAQRGLRILSDDTLYVQLEPRFRLWALPRPIHVFAHDAPAGAHPTRNRGGKRKAAIAVPNALGYADTAVPILLKHGEQLELTKLDPTKARACLPPLEPGFDLLRQQSAAVADALLNQGAWRLTLTRDPDAAITFLLRHFERAHADPPD